MRMPLERIAVSTNSRISMINRSCHRWLGEFFTVLIISCVLPINALSGAVSLNDIEGSWRTDVILPSGARIQSHIVVNQKGDYIEYLTNEIAGQVDTGTLVGTICITNDCLIFTITNDFVEHTILPRTGGFVKVVGFSHQQLSFVPLIGPNRSNRVDYLRDLIVVKPAQTSKALQKAERIELSSVKFDSLPLTVVIAMLQDESVKHDAARKGVTISLGSDDKQLANVEVNLNLRDITLAAAIGRVADSVGLEMQATDTEILLVRKKAK
jgi:hypothetical protein